MNKTYAVGKNMPGYMPDETPAHVEELEEAKRLLVADVRRYIEECEEEAGDLCGDGSGEPVRLEVYRETLEQVEAAPAMPCNVYIGPYVFFISEV